MGKMMNVLVLLVMIMASIAAATPATFGFSIGKAIHSTCETGNPAVDVYTEEASGFGIVASADSYGVDFRIVTTGTVDYSGFLPGIWEISHWVPEGVPNYPSESRRFGIIGEPFVLAPKLAGEKIVFFASLEGSGAEFDVCTGLQIIGSENDYSAVEDATHTVKVDLVDVMSGYVLDTIYAVPEPTTMSLMVIGSMAVAWRRRQSGNYR